ncbi:MAG: mechanosensitive ion channel [Saprospiraceae bacterium]|nr:mechanosensitive ion channel [Saprospiraceae bacterium]
MENFFNLEELGKIITAYTPKVAGAVLTLILGFWIIGRITRSVKRTMERNQLDQSITPFLSSIVNVGLKVLLLLSVARMFGVETTSFVAIFSALTLAIGLALQGSLGHFASGVLILIFKPYKVGDLVSIGGGSTGTVQEIQVFNTVLQTLDNKRIIIPNGVVTNNTITNISGQGIIGVEFTFGISYQDSIDKAREIILKVADECPYILKEPATAVLVGPWGDSSINLASRPFCKSEDYWNTYFYMYEHVKKAFDANGISIPFPQMDVHMMPNNNK